MFLKLWTTDCGESANLVVWVREMLVETCFNIYGKITRLKLNVGSSWQADSPSVKQFREFYGNPNVHYRANNSPSLVRIVSQINPVHAFPSNFVNVYFNIILCVCLGLLRSLFHSGFFFHQIPKCIALSLNAPSRDIDICCQLQYGWTPGGSSTVHIYTQTIHRTTQLIWEECWPCPVFASYTLAFALQLKKKQGKTSVRVAEEWQLARWKENIQNRAYITIRINITIKIHNLQNYLIIGIGLTPGGSSTVHSYTQTIHRTTQLIWEECWPCPVFASYTLAFALQLKKRHGKTSVSGCPAHLVPSVRDTREKTLTSTVKKLVI